jgi:DNA-binding transcriptional LysR family regulator
MDKLRALEYLAAAATHGSFSAAARQLEVSVQSVAKLITALERELGIIVVQRTPQGLTVTPAGESYLEACRPALAQLHEADEWARTVGERLRGTLVVAVQPAIAHGCMADLLPRFHARHPEVEIDLRTAEHPAQVQMPDAHVTLMLGWPKVAELVCRKVGAGRFMVVAAPAYWARHGMPQRPRDLDAQSCLPIRGIDGMVMDVWNFVRGGEQESVLACGWLTTSHAHRNLVVELAMAGHGVLRVLDWINRSEVVSGSLVEVLKDWQSTEAVPVNVLYPPGTRRLPVARAFIEFVSETFRALDAGRGGRVIGTDRPSWMRRPHGRASDVRVASK